MFPPLVSSVRTAFMAEGPDLAWPELLDRRRLPGQYYSVPACQHAKPTFPDDALISATLVAIQI